MALTIVTHTYTHRQTLMGTDPNQGLGLQWPRASHRRRAAPVFLVCRCPGRLAVWQQMLAHAARAFAISHDMVWSELAACHSMCLCVCVRVWMGGCVCRLAAKMTVFTWKHCSDIEDSFEI